MSELTISDAGLRMLWGVNQRTMSDWHVRGWLTCDGGVDPKSRTNPDSWHYYSSIENLHRIGCNNDVQLPTVAELLEYLRETGKPPFLKIKEVAKLLEVDTEAVLRLTNARKITAVRLPNTKQWLYHVDVVTAYLSQQSETVSLGFVSRITGVGTNHLGRVVVPTRSILKLSENPPSNNGLWVTKESLIAYLNTYLARDSEGKQIHTAEEWLAMRERHDYEPFVTPRQIVNSCRVKMKTVVVAIKNGMLPCIFTPGGNGRIPMHAFNSWRELRKRTN